MSESWGGLGDGGARSPPKKLKMEGPDEVVASRAQGGFVRFWLLTVLFFASFLSLGKPVGEGAPQ